MKGADVMSEVNIQIVDGGSREELRDSLGRFPHQSSRSILLTLEISAEQAKALSSLGPTTWPAGRQQVPLLVNKMEWEDGSGEKFNIHGYLPAHKLCAKGGFYDCRRRKGYLVF